MIWGIKAALVGGNISPSKFLERNSPHLSAGRIVGSVGQYTRQMDCSKSITCGGSSPLTSSFGIRPSPSSRKHLMYQAGFAIFSSTEVKLRDLEFCFIATSKLCDWRGIQIGIFSHFSHTTIYIFQICADTPLTTRSRATWWQDVPSWLCDIF